MKLRSEYYLFFRILATEAYANISTLMQYYGTKTKVGAHIPFNFGFVTDINRNNLVESIDATIKNWLDNIPENMVANWVVRVFKFKFKFF